MKKLLALIAILGLTSVFAAEAPKKVEAPKTEVVAEKKADAKAEKKEVKKATKKADKKEEVPAAK